jgi:mono/diheme cytochrome c family protein
MSLRIATLACLMMLSACERGLHQMYDQPKYQPLAPSPLFADGNSSRQQVPGTVPRSAGPAAVSSSGRNGLLLLPSAPPQRLLPDAVSPELSVDQGSPLPVTPALLERGRERFNIYCAPCHSKLGDGDGMVARRGFPAPPSFHTARLREAPDSHFFAVITQGYGVMYPYADRITVEDRWAITAYIRALQFSQHAPAGLLSAADRQRLGP